MKPVYKNHRDISESFGLQGTTVRSFTRTRRKSSEEPSKSINKNSSRRSSKTQRKMERRSDHIQPSSGQRSWSTQNNMDLWEETKQSDKNKETSGIFPNPPENLHIIKCIWLLWIIWIQSNWCWRTTNSSNIWLHQSGRASVCNFCQENVNRFQNNSSVE